MNMDMNMDMSMGITTRHMDRDRVDNKSVSPNCGNIEDAECECCDLDNVDNFTMGQNKDIPKDIAPNCNENFTVLLFQKGKS